MNWIHDKNKMTKATIIVSSTNKLSRLCFLNKQKKHNFLSTTGKAKKRTIRRNKT